MVKAIIEALKTAARIAAQIALGLLGRSGGKLFNFKKPENPGIKQGPAQQPASQKSNPLPENGHLVQVFGQVAPRGEAPAPAPEVAPEQPQPAAASPQQNFGM